jgi:hypothetical protein
LPDRASRLGEASQLAEIDVFHYLAGADSLYLQLYSACLRPYLRDEPIVQRAKYYVSGAFFHRS